MKTPRSVSGEELVKALQRIGYKVTRQTGSHIRMTNELTTQHHVTVPNHKPLRIGTLFSILSNVAKRMEMSKDELARRLFY